MANHRVRSSWRVFAPLPSPCLEVPAHRSSNHCPRSLFGQQRNCISKQPSNCCRNRPSRWALVAPRSMHHLYRLDNETAPHSRVTHSAVGLSLESSLRTPLPIRLNRERAVIGRPHQPSHHESGIGHRSHPHIVGKLRQSAVDWTCNSLDVPSALHWPVQEAAWQRAPR